MQEVPIMLPCKGNKTRVLCEMPGNVDMEGDSGVVGRICTLPSDLRMGSTTDFWGDGADSARMCMDLKGATHSCPMTYNTAIGLCNSASQLPVYVTHALSRNTMYVTSNLTHLADAQSLFKT